MVTLKRKVITSRPFPDLHQRLEEARRVTRFAIGLDFEYHISEEDVGTPETYTDNEGRLRINHYWYQGMISNKAVAEGYDGAVYIYTLDDARRWGGLGSGLKGAIIIDGDYFDEMWIRSDHDTMDQDGYRIARTLAHEEGHAVKQRGITNLEVHDFDRNEEGDLETFFRNVDATNYQKPRYQMIAIVLRQALIELILRLTGKKKA